MENQKSNKENTIPPNENKKELKTMIQGALSNYVNDILVIKMLLRNGTPESVLNTFNNDIPSPEDYAQNLRERALNVGKENIPHNKLPFTQYPLTLEDLESIEFIEETKKMTDIINRMKEMLKEEAEKEIQTEEDKKRIGGKFEALYIEMEKLVKPRSEE